MLCEPVRIALAAGDPLSAAAEAHLTTCASCATARRIVGMAAPAVTVPPPVVPAPAAFRRRERRWVAGRVALAATVILLAIGVFAHRAPAPASVASTEPVAAPRASELLSLDFELIVPGDPLGDSPLDLGDDLDPLAAFDLPTDLLEHALSGEGRL